MSDHRPVKALFKVPVALFDQEAKNTFGVINFPQFVMLLSNFSVKAKNEEKMEYIEHLLHAIGADGGKESIGELQREEYKEVLGVMAKDSLPSFIMEDLMDSKLIDVSTTNGDFSYLVSDYELKTSISTVF